MNIFVPGKGQLNPRIAFVGEAPSYEEEEALEPFVGTAGRFFNKILSDVGINRSDCWVTNACKYRVPPNAKKGRQIPFHVRATSVGIDMNDQITKLRYELQDVKPTVVVALGNTALWAMTGKHGIEKQRGSIMLGMGIKTIPTYHPMHILYQEAEVGGFWTKKILEFDLNRAKQESAYPDLRLPYRNLQVCKSPQQFADFIHRHRNHTKPGIDIEAHKCIPICTGIAFTPDEGITIPLWNSYGISDLPDEVIIVFWKMLAEFLEKQDVVGQNFGYDRDKILRLGYTVRSLASDTMLKAFAINPELPKNLAFNTSIYTREPYYKDEGMYEGTMHDLLIGCARDACVTKEVDIAQDADIDELGVRDYYENFLLKLHPLYLKIENNGFNVSLKKRKELIDKYVRMREQKQYELSKLAGWDVNVSSWQQVRKLLYTDWKIPERSGTDEETLTSILNSNVIAKDEVKRMGIDLILELRRVKKTINTYLYALADFDGRMRTSYFLCLETGRSSTNQQEAPIRPTHEYRDEERKKKKQSYGMAFQTITKHGDIGSDIRAFLIPDEGYVFLQGDSSQAEARVIFLLAEDYQALKDIDEHDYHALTASWFFGGTELDYSKKVLGYESPIRFAGKTLRHAGHLGAKARRASISVNTDARKYNVRVNGVHFKISEAEAEKALKIFHAKQPKIRNVYHASVISSLERNRQLIAPVPVGIAAKVGGTRIFYERWGDELFRQAFSYIPQRTVSENTKSAALYLDKESGREIQILVESHDALCIQVKEKYRVEAAKMMKYAFERPIDFSTCSIPRSELVIPCEIEIGYNYKDLSKFSWMGEAA